MEEQQRVFVGLGNPGKKYAMTRHNIGFLIAEVFTQQTGLSFKEEPRFQSVVAKGESENVKLHILLPQTYMNESGRAIRLYLDYYKLPVSSVVTISDEIALPLGQMRLNAFGSPGGHNGLKSVEMHLGTHYYKRLRVGIGNNPRIPLEDYVLAPFTQEEAQKLPEILTRGSAILKRLLREEIQTVMNSVNQKSVLPVNQGEKNEA